MASALAPIWSLPAAIWATSFCTTSKLASTACGLLVLGLRAGDDALEFATHGRDLALDRKHRVFDANGVLTGIARKAADILRYDGESFAELTGARRFDRAVHRQHVGLDRHHADSIDDLVNVAADVFEASDQFQALTHRLYRPRHALRQVADLQPAFAKHRVHPPGPFKRRRGAFAERLRGLLDLIHRRAGFLRRGGLLLGSAADLIYRTHDLRSRARHLLNGC